MHLDQMSAELINAFRTEVADGASVTLKNESMGILVVSSVSHHIRVLRFTHRTLDLGVCWLLDRYGLRCL